MSHAIGPDGQIMTKKDLPPLDTKRWVARRKAELIAGIRGGLITFEEAQSRYALSEEELQSWTAQVERHGVEGLSAKEILKNRQV